MKKQLFFKTSISRKNPITTFFLGLFTITVSMPRMMCETFTRKNFGERYWNIGWAIVYTFILLPAPIVGFSPMKIFGLQDQMGAGERILDGITWSIFIGAFIFKSIMHWSDQRRNPSTFDFGKYSYYNGTLNKWFSEFKLNGKRLDIRTIETLVEPGFFFAVGLILILLHQTLGFFLLSSSIAYSASRFLDYHNGDEQVLDIIDSIIIKEDYEDAFMNEMAGENTRGLHIPSRRPKNMEQRQKVVNAMFGETDEEQRTYVA